MKSFVRTMVLMAVLAVPTMGSGQDKAVPDSIWSQYFVSGKLRQETPFQQGMVNGSRLTYFRHPNCLKEEAAFKNDTLHGPRLVYGRGCRLIKVENYKDGKLNGTKRIYRRDGRIKYEVAYTDGTRGPKTKHGKDGPRPSRNDSYIKGKLDPYMDTTQSLPDSSVFKQLARLYSSGNTIIVADVTGSMYSWLGQMMAWARTQPEAVSLVVFNDGDGKPDMAKRAGSTGGIYTGSISKLKEMKNFLEKAIQKGDGGDPQENNLEAVQAGLKKFKGTTQVIMLADRRSPVRDMFLLPGIRVPVYVVLCGPEGYTHPHYLDIARRTGGLISTLDENITLKHFRDGDRLELAGMTYVLKRGKFALVPPATRR